MSVKCIWCQAEATKFFRYAINGRHYVTARCSKHTHEAVVWDGITKEDYLAHKAMEAL